MFRPKSRIRSTVLVVAVIMLSYLLLVIDGGLLVLLVLGDQVVHVALGLSELHLVHALISVPVEESLGTVG